jgi:hypothetical protein
MTKNRKDIKLKKLKKQNKEENKMLSNAIKSADRISHLDKDVVEKLAENSLMRH